MAQHALVAAMARAGTLPSEAVDYLVPDQLVQPWQYVPASYVLFEAEWLGRATEWEEGGRVEIEWIGQEHRRVPGWIPLYGVGPGGTLGPDPNGPNDYVQEEGYSKVYVGARRADRSDLQRISGLDPDDEPPGTPTPPLWIPNMDPGEWGPQMLLYAATRVVRRGHGGIRRTPGRPRPGYRSLIRTGPFLDVRLIDRVRIMERRGRRWV